jgi:signal transduction histidine kinase/ActR/RegA family two-component response regulator
MRVSAVPMAEQTRPERTVSPPGTESWPAKDHPSPPAVTEALSRAAGHDPGEISRARAVIRLNLACVMAWIAINAAAAWWLHNGRPLGVAAAGLGMTVAFSVALWDIARGRMARAVAIYTISGLLLLLAMGLFLPELAILFTFATFIFLAFGLSYMSGRASMWVVALTICVALLLLLTSQVFRWTSGVPDQLYRWINVTGMLMALSIDAVMFVMLRGTLEQRAQNLVAAERAASEMQDRLAQQDRLESLGQLAGGVAHDFNNLLGVILNFSLFAKEKVLAAAGPIEPGREPTSRDLRSAADDMDRVVRAGESAGRLTHQLLAFARREVLRPQALDINTVVRELDPLLRRTLGEHIQVETSLSRDVWPALMDRGQLEQVLTNLTINARDAMPNGGRLVIDTENIDVDEAYAAGRPELKPGQYIRMRVSDTGTGMDEHTLQHVFEPFFTTKPKGHGTGLGLATVYGIIQQSHGYITIYSEIGRGTRISVLLPATAGASVDGRNAPVERGVVGTGTVLVVEDAEDLREVTERILTRNGYKVISAPDGPSAIEESRRHEGKIDLLLTDVVMPKMQGKQLADRIASTRPGIRVLFMSGYAETMLGESGILEPGVQLVGKPFTEPELLAKVAEAMSGERPAPLVQSRVT